MRIAIRVDASSQIGTGHFMRCLTLANALKQCYVHIRFVSRHLPEHLRSMLVSRGYEFTLLDSINNAEAIDELAHAAWLGTSQAQDAADSIQALSDVDWDWLIVDHYALDSCWESALRQAAKKIMVIDDIADRQHDCDVLLDQNLYVDMETRYTSKVPPHCQLLLGPRYALLRDEFRQLHEQIKPRTGPVKRALVFFGGVDAANYTGKTIEALAGNGNLLVDVVIGAQHPHRTQVESACAEHGFVCHVQTEKMAELIAAADLAIGAGGSATWERCCLGLPTLTICAADNQRKQIADAASEGILYTHELQDNFIHTIRQHVSTLMENSCLRYFISRKAMQTVDGRGVSRVIRNFGCGGIEMRTATSDDSAKLFEWRNHPSIRSVSRCAEMINWEDHQKWFASVLAASDRLLLIGQREGYPVGVVRFDIHGDVAEVSIYLVPGNKQLGQGSDLLRSAEHWFAVHRPEVHKLSANVLRDNGPSQRLFVMADYQVESTSYSKMIK